MALGSRNDNSGSHILSNIPNLIGLSKFIKTIFFIKLQFQSVEYSVYVYLEILILVTGIILRFGNWSSMHSHATENSSTCNWNSVTVTQFYDNFIKVLLQFGSF